MWQYFVFRQTEPKPSKVTKDDHKKYSGFIRQVEVKLNGEQKVEHIFVAPPYCQTILPIIYFFNSGTDL
jgi:hypothetical protein